ncbi:MAG: 1-(5-phosphoribosyl)-5-[(5-phosphoribosylamino)methylideneamino]imidazole-4-carboxamide isomerase [Acidobacteria bacterium]|nr:1-(5-phosphoribosyl)-5-[(5-phosphoribosylamino)methylideneamino]imidazole-4-carboxamide isomerase [Acidobacteriota bacterium]
MNFYPAIDLLDGKCVRLKRGSFEQVTVYSDNPVEIAANFARAGATWIHVVDLNAARTGVQANLSVVEEIARSLPEARLQWGGGLRSVALIVKALSCGISRCVIGTAAVERSFLQQLAEFSNQLAVGMDVDGGTVRVAGWTADSGIGVKRFLSEVRQASLQYLVVTDISRDGMLCGPNVALLKQVAAEGFQVIASGGVASLSDLKLLATEIPQLEGVIVGKALYEGKFTVKEAIHCLRSIGSPNAS